MKKSVVEDVIRQQLMEVVFNYEVKKEFGTLSKEDFFKNQAIELLNILTNDLGMIPPEYNKPDGKYFDRVNEWEAE